MQNLNSTEKLQHVFFGMVRRSSWYDKVRVINDFRFPAWSNISRFDYEDSFELVPTGRGLVTDFYDEITLEENTVNDTVPEPPLYYSGTQGNDTGDSEGNGLAGVEDESGGSSHDEVSANENNSLVTRTGTASHPELVWEYAQILEFAWENSSERQSKRGRFFELWKIRERDPASDGTDVQLLNAIVTMYKERCEATHE